MKNPSGIISRSCGNNALDYHSGGWPNFLIGNFILSFCIAFLMTGQVRAAEKFTYDVTLSGLEGKAFADIRSLFNEASLLQQKKADPLVSVTNLQSRLKSDISLLNRILRAEGHYGAVLKEEITRQKNHFTIKIRVDPGPIYLFGKLNIDYHPPQPNAEIRTIIEDKLINLPGNPARAADVILAEAKISKVLPEIGFPFAQKAKADIVVDHRDHTLNLSFALKTGDRRQFGTTRLMGLQAIKEDHITQFIPWQQGAVFDQRLINDLRARLNKTGLFAIINMDVKAAGNDFADVDLTFTEAKHRTIGASAGYSTAEGVSGEILWEHRNFLGRGNVLKFAARGGEIGQSFSSRLEIPNFARLDQTLSFEGGYRRQDTDAFLAHTITSNIGLHRIMTSELALRAGVELEYSDITDAEGKRDFYVAALPLGLHWDNSDNLLDPHRGTRLSFFTAPTISMDGEQIFFLKSELRASFYYPLIDEKTVLALRQRLGSIHGAETTSLPATRRFFAGGGGSIRGFAFQRVGPLSPDNTPLGGRSVTEFAAELRWKLSDRLSIVPFAEGGNVYDSSLPKLSDLRWSLGLGGRYHTDFGPIRLDMAFPLNRRHGDSRFQIYISLGQAF